jgi:hypothetical protein
MHDGYAEDSPSYALANLHKICDRLKRQHSILGATLDVSSFFILTGTTFHTVPKTRLLGVASMAKQLPSTLRVAGESRLTGE